MTFLEILDSLLFRPLQYLFELIYMNVYRVIGSPGLSIIALSLVMNCLLLPLYKRADALQEEERQTEARLSAGVAQIKKAFRGDERMMILQTYYRQNNYKPTYVLRGAVSLLLEIPFFMAAYRFLSNLTLLQGVALGPIADLGVPDGLLVLGGVHINILPILMTTVNLVSCVIFTQGAPLKSKLQLYGMAIFFLFFLYDSPSGLVFYWTLNNLFSLGKTVFYKLKDPQKILRGGASLLGLGMLVWILFFYRQHRPIVKTVVLLAGGLLQLPLVLHRMHIQKKQREEKPADARLFFLAAFFLAVFAGAYIPLSVLASSAEEFVNALHYQSPLWFVVSSFCLALGSFVIWPGVFYGMAETGTKKKYEKAVFVLMCAAILNFMAFGKNLGVLTSSLRYEKFSPTLSEVLWNGAAVAAVGLAAVLLLGKWEHSLKRVITVLLLATVVVSGVNAANVNGQVSGLRHTTDDSGETPAYTLSKNGKNVVVIMMDRAMGEFVPVIFQEKPELQEQFDGFTAYTNVVSAGAFTNFGVPSLMGGYEYTVENLNKRSEESLQEKHNEALKVMPVLFLQNGFDVTVMQPPYANYMWIPDLGIYSDYPQIKRYNVEETLEGYESWAAANMRNFFMYSLMRVSPTALQIYIYDKGNYNGSNQTDDVGLYTEVDAHSSTGINSEFMRSYEVLTNLPSMTQISEGTENTFHFMANDATHDVQLLQAPDYVPQAETDNTEYDLEHEDRFVTDGAALRMYDFTQFEHYSANMAAMLRLGNWFDYLRQNGVYDNTRIILVSDHGKGLNANEKRILPDGTDTEFFYPILLVKDFGAKGFAYSDAFMTTADVPTLATMDLIRDPVNPFTGNPINSDQKEQGKTYVFYSTKWDVKENNGTQFLPGTWYRIDNQNMQEKNNWVRVGENTCFPED